MQVTFSSRSRTRTATFTHDTSRPYWKPFRIETERVVRRRDGVEVKKRHCRRFTTRLAAMDYAEGFVAA